MAWHSILSNWSLGIVDGLMNKKKKKCYFHLKWQMNDLYDIEFIAIEPSKFRRLIEMPIYM